MPLRWALLLYMVNAPITSAGGAAEGSQGQARSEAERAAPGGRSDNFTR